MMLIVRLYYKGQPEKIWDYLNENLKGHGSRKVRPLYISQLHGRNFLSAVFDVDKIDFIVKFLMQQIGECQNVVDTQTLTLMKPVFLPIPKDRKKRMCRFSIFFKVVPKYYHDVYNELLDHKYGKDAFPTYIAYSLGEYDILVSMMGENPDTIKNLVEEKLSKFKGVTDCTLNHIEKSELMASKDTWRRLQRSLLHVPPWATKDIKKHYLYDYDISSEDYCKLTGAMIDEL